MIVTQGSIRIKVEMEHNQFANDDNDDIGHGSSFLYE